MHEPDRLDPLTARALLYAAGELDGPDAEAFERLLAADQAARDALTNAVRLSLALDPRLPRGPGPRCREQVRRRLRPGLWARLTAPRLSRGHPAAWGLLGAAAALLLVAGWELSQWSGRAAAPQAAPLSDVRPADDEPDEPGDAAVADFWARSNLHNPDHLMRARDDEARRKARAGDRLVPGRKEPFRVPYHAAPGKTP
jgi:hypothetical protein